MRLACPIAMLATVVLVAAGPALAADPVVGLWKTQPDDNGRYATVEIYPCETQVCGVIRKAFNADGSERASDAVGKRMLWGMSATGDGSYGGGKIWAPDRDKVYSSKMALSGNALKVSGCVFGICRNQAWTRLP